MDQRETSSVTTATTPTAVQLPLMRWGRPDASRHALFLHGLTSAAACWWLVADELAEAGWSVTAPDLRGHGLAPRTRRYDIEGFAADVLPLTPDGGGAWDLVVGHSLGGVVATAAASAEPGWASRLLLLDPVITVSDGVEEVVRGILTELNATPESLLRDHPEWHPEDVFLKVQAARRTSPYVVESFLRKNAPWSYEKELTEYARPVTVLAADPRRDPVFTADDGRRIGSAKADFRWTAVEGAGHSVYRDNPAAVIAAALDEPEPDRTERQR
ncbi:alpha/beta fold hydrolase [Streptomyces sp. NPDC102274]|uniref:alpha/beta fold hydrolase n=1 Tax=Streptomyces sp. NPDC102274 TaxID=3366151 RepID=UPI0037FDE70A